MVQFKWDGNLSLAINYHKYFPKIESHVAPPQLEGLHLSYTYIYKTFIKNLKFGVDYNVLFHGETCNAMATEIKSQTMFQHLLYHTFIYNNILISAWFLVNCKSSIAVLQPSTWGEV